MQHSSHYIYIAGGIWHYSYLAQLHFQDLYHPKINKTVIRIILSHQTILSLIKFIGKSNN